MKRIQNKVAESRFSLPTMSAYALAVWLVSGLLIPHVPMTVADLWDGAWVQFVCFVVSAYLMVELNNSNALIRIYSRMVTCSFLAMLCAAAFLLGLMKGAIVLLCVIAAYTTLFRTYQNRQATGWTYYAFLCFGLASVAWVQVLWFLPVVWLLMWTQLSSLSWRTLAASLIGLLTPYWFISAALLFTGDFYYLVDHFKPLVSDFVYFQISTVNSQLSVVVFAFIVVLYVTGTIHYIRNSSDDKIRIRQLYGFFMGMGLASIVLIVLQPRHYDPLLRLLIVNTAPLIGHFLALTKTRITNIAFFVICAACVDRKSVV